MFDTEQILSDAGHNHTFTGIVTLLQQTVNQNFTTIGTLNVIFKSELINKIAHRSNLYLQAAIY